MDNDDTLSGDDNAIEIIAVELERINWEFIIIELEKNEDPYIRGLAAEIKEAI